MPDITVVVENQKMKKRLAKLERALADIPPAEQGFSAVSARKDREGH